MIQHDLAAMGRAVRRHQRDRITDPLDEAREDQPGLVGAGEGTPGIVTA